MRAGTIIALSVAIVFGGLAAFLARTFILDAATPQAPVKIGTIVVASQPLQFGANLTRDNLSEIPWPGEPLEGSFTTVAELLKDGRRLALASVQKNEPILGAKITGPNQRATLSTLIEEGMRAVSLNVDEVRGVAGFILPGDRVDVVLIRQVQGEGGPSADVLLQNVKVLAIDQLANERADKPTVARAVTIELNLQQSQKVILAQGIGRLSLILRQAGEETAGAAARRVTMADLGLTEEISSKKEDDRLAQVEAQVEDMRKATEVSDAAARDEAMKRIAELEALLHKKLEQPAAPMPVVAVRKTDDRVIVNVIRGISKRDEYTVSSEQR